MTDSPEQLGQTPTANSNKGCGWVTIAVSVGIVLLIGSFMLPMFDRGRQIRIQHNRQNSLKRIWLALRQYHDDYDSLPPAYTVDHDGRPLHSWRTLILPYLEQQNLYDKIDLSKPWNDPINKPAAKLRPSVFAPPSGELPETSTTFMAIVGAEYCFHPNTGRRLPEISDSHSDTLMVIEASTEHTTHWMTPTDVTPPFLLADATKNAQEDAHYMYSTMVDGSIRVFTSQDSKMNWRALLTIAADDHSEEESGNSTTGDSQP